VYSVAECLTRQCSEIYSSVFHFFQDKGYEEAKVVIEALKQKGISKIGAAGYCWGGEVSFLVKC